MMLWVTSLLGLIPSLISRCVYLPIMCLLTIHFWVYFAYNILLNYLISQDLNQSVLKSGYFVLFWAVPGLCCGIQGLQLQHMNC